LLAIQLVAQLFSVNQLTPVIGKIKKMSGEITSYSSAGRWKKGRPNYAVALTLDNGQVYTVEVDDSDQELYYDIAPGISVRLFIITPIYKWMSFDFLITDGNIGQLERSGSVFYSFSHHKRKCLWLVVFTCAFLAVAGQRFYWIKKNFG
jgi:hypothetical protein